jgi:hypothetical protein
MPLEIITLCTPLLTPLQNFVSYNRLLVQVVILPKLSVMMLFTQGS